MTPAAFVPHGIDPITQTPLFIAELSSFSALEKPDLPAKPLKLFIAGDAGKLSTEDICPDC
jgi:hypothetical protein